jgi:GH15 family glucan-1,4-alpha-glucosidase
VGSVAGDLGILSEQVDPASRELLGNVPLVFSHAEYLRAFLMLQQQREATAPALVGRKETH